MIKPEDGHYIAGLVDGEGYFSLWMKTDSKSKRGGVNISSSFGIKLRSDDGEILSWMQKILGCGRIRYAPRLKSPSVEFCVTKREDCERIIIPLFESYPLRAKKKRDFEVWKEAVHFLYSLMDEKRAYIERSWKPKWTDERKQIFNQYIRRLRNGRKFEEAAHKPFTNSFIYPLWRGLSSPIFKT